jgi:DNA segregation ATPase FtsK/SpoIIIE, S-DNA-T family
VMRIAVLPTRERLKLIAAIRSLAPGRDYPPPASFDPDTPAEFVPMDPMDPMAPAASGRTVQAWLGEAIEIKPATAATFERYVRSNLLVVGGEEHGHGLLLATLLSAAVQRSPADVRFTIAEFTRPSSSFHGFFAAAERLPHEVRIADRKTAGAALDDLLAELDTRLAEPDGPDGSPQPEVFFLVAGMHRWHELVTEGDYGRPSETSACLVRLAEAGPDVGIHVVAWADSYTTAERALRRAGLAHFGLRAAARLLSPAESDALLGVSAAAGLDDNRALYRDTEWPAEQVEKFKPYSIASLHAFAQAFRSPA